MRTFLFSFVEGDELVVHEEFFFSAHVESLCI